MRLLNRMQLIHTVLVCVLTISIKADRENAWNLRISDTSRDGRFLNVPIYYGDWVPITKAKQTIEAVASKIEAATKSLRSRVDPPPEIITADQPEDRVDHQIVPYEPSSHYSQWSQPQQQPQSHHWRPPRPQRPPRRRVDNLRSKHRNHRKLPHNKPIFNIFNHQQVPTEKPAEVDTTTQSSLLGNVFNFFNPLLSGNNKPDIILHDSPVIKTLPAPDLTKVNEIFSLKSNLHFLMAKRWGAVYSIHTVPTHIL